MTDSVSKTDNVQAQLGIPCYTISNETSQDFEDHVKRTQESNARSINWENVGQSGLQ